jgi:hypothetical protein
MQNNDCQPEITAPSRMENSGRRIIKATDAEKTAFANLYCISKFCIIREDGETDIDKFGGLARREFPGLFEWWIVTAPWAYYICAVISAWAVAKI